jgi:biotin carboxylase
MWTTKDKNLLIIGGGILQHQTLVECGTELGKVLVDGNPDCYCAKSYLFNNDYFVHADIKDPNLVLSQVKKFLKRKRNVKLVGVYTQGCDIEYTVAYVAEKLGLPSIGSEVAFKCNNKIAMREAFDKKQIPQPLHFIAENLIKAGVLAKVMGYPCVFKPVDNCASRGLTIVMNQSEVIDAYYNALNNSKDKKVLIEEFIDGKEYSVDTIVYKGKVYPAGISDRIFQIKEKYAIQDGSLTPSLLPEETQKQIYWIMQDCSDAIGLKWGAFKGDFIIGNNIKVLEVTARLSGGFDAQFRKPYSFGINLIKATIDLACGKPLDFEDIIPKWFKYSATFTVFPKSGIIKEILGEEELKNIEGIKQVFITKKVGDKIDYKNCADRVIHIIACRNTYNELQETIQKAKETIQFITE